MKYDGQLIQIPTPTNVTLTEDYYAEFNYDLEDPEENVDDVTIDLELVGIASMITYPSTIEWENGLCRADLKEAIRYLYSYWGIEGEVEVTYKVRLFSNGNKYSSSEYSEASNKVKYDGFKAVENIFLSPNSPIVCKDHSYYLGKTIDPVDAYYSNIDWSSDNTNNVTVDEDGQITGIASGTANVTAAIDEVSDTVPVTVYTISSNVDDEEDNQEVIDTAGDIIDDIVNNDNPNLENTDIDENDIDEIKDDIQEGIENGDTFHTDIVAIQETYDKYKLNWGQVQKATRMLNAQFEGAYNIEVEMYHKSHDNVEHHIGNITELGNEITFTFDLPTGMKEQQSGQTKKYVLVRVHKLTDGTMEYSPVDYVINGDGTFTTQSNCFSDFIWCSVETSDLDEITGLSWVDDSTATLQWDAFPDADYYDVDITVLYHGSEVGTTNTGTGSTSIDLQQEIRSVVGVNNYKEVKVKGKVTAYHTENDERTPIAQSGYSEEKTYVFNYDLSAPTNLVLDSNSYVLSFDEVEDATDYEILLLKGDDPDGGCQAIASAAITGIGTGTVTADLTDDLMRFCSGWELYKNDTVKICATVTAYAKNDGSISAQSNPSEPSNVIDYEPNVQKLATPTNLYLDSNTGNLTFNGMDDVSEYIVSVGNNQYGLVREQYFSENGHGTEQREFNITALLSEFYEQYGDSSFEEPMDIYAAVSGIKKDVQTNSIILAWSETSDNSNTISYLPRRIELEKPTNVKLDATSLELSFNRVDNATEYMILIWSGTNGGVGFTYPQKGEGTNTIRYDLSELITNFTYSTEISEEGVYATIDARAKDENGVVIGQAERVRSNAILYTNVEVESLTLSPDSPSCYIGKTRSLGKTIEPLDAYYENIEWESNHPEIVTVDENGRITGIAVGSATITARIGTVEDSVIVNVYDISTNIQGEENQQNATELSGDIIDGIVNNDTIEPDPNIEKTDIEQSELAQIREELQQAFANGDSFHTDLTAVEQYYEKYKLNWGKVQNATRYLNAQFEGAYNIEVELYHKDKNNNKHHIGNITELDNEITFTFDLPTGMKEQQSGNTKKYVLVRVHKCNDGTMEYSPVDYQIDYENGTFTATSDCYSDFIWCSVDGDTEDGVVIAKGASLTLAGEIGLNFKIQIPDEIKESDSKAIITYKGVEEEISLTGLQPVTWNGVQTTDVYQFTKLLPAKESGNLVRIRIVNPDGIAYIMKKSDGTPFENNEMKYSINDYTEYYNEYYKTHEDKKGLMPLLSAMSDYSAFAQGYFRSGDKGLTPLDDGSESRVEAVSKEDLAQYKVSIDGTVPGLSITSLFLTLESETTINIRLRLDEGSNIEDYKFYIDDTEVTPQKNGNDNIIVIPNVSAKDLDTKYTLRVEKGEEYFTARLCALSYVYSILNASDEYKASVAKYEELSKAMRALYLYNQAANVYFEQ